VLALHTFMPFGYFGMGVPDDASSIEMRGDPFVQKNAKPAASLVEDTPYQSISKRKIFLICHIQKNLQTHKHFLRHTLAAI
jgi:hypothetical protein